MKKLNIAIVGLGNIGSYLYKYLNDNKKILTEKIEDLHIVAKGLIEFETLTFKEVKDLLKGIKPDRDDFDNDVGAQPSITPSVPKTSSNTSPQIS